MRHDLTSLFSALYSRVWRWEGVGREDVGRAGQVRHTTGHWQDPTTWSMSPGFDIGGREAAASELQTRTGTKVFAPINCICGCRWECGTVTRTPRKVTTSPSLPPRSFSFSLPQMGYSGDGPDRPWFGFWFMFLWSSNQRFHLLLLYGSWDDEWCSLSVKPSLCVFAPHFNC